jgi:hypothetical protein
VLYQGDELLIIFGIIGMVFVFIIVFIVLPILLGKHEHRAITRSRLRHSKYIKTTNLNLEAKLLQMFLHATDEEFNDKFADYSKRINYKFRTEGGGKYHSTLKRSLRNVIYKYTNQLPKSRIDKYLDVFPLLRRVYFGPKLTKTVYSEELKKPKFHFEFNDTIPRFDTVIDVALFFGTTVNIILGYCYAQTPNNRSYYRLRKRKEYSNRYYKRYYITKKNGSKRLISVPRYRLKVMQRKILHEILEKAVCHDSCKGFMVGKSIKDNAIPHVSKATLVKMDLKEFFPSLRFSHVFQVFRGFGYSRPVAGVLTCLCTDYFENKHFAPQGAPTSPTIGNLYASHLDARLNGLWTKNGFSYSRYADDITFSSKDPTIKPGKLIHATYEIIKNEKLQPNYKKTKVFRKGNQLKVTGVIVNDKLNIDREWIRKLRAEVHHLTTKGPTNDEETIHLRNQVMGKISYLNMINPDKAQKYKIALQNKKE